jgi:hypothetical protein
MNSQFARRRTLLARFVAAVTITLAQASSANSVSSDSVPADDLRAGEYLAASAAPYDGFVRFAEYVTVRDGTRIAVDS